MFKQSSFASEIYDSMVSNLTDTDIKYNQEKLSEAALLLRKSASIFNNAGKTLEAQAILHILNSLGKLNEK